MSETLPTTKPHEWSRDGFIISTEPSLIDASALNAAFSTPDLPWATALSPTELTTMLSRSVCFGLYSATASLADTHSSPTHHAEHSEDPRPAMIGLARLITDCTTFAYLTDVYVLPEWRGRGLGSWLVGCVREWWDLMPSGRRLVFIASEGAKEEYYAGKLGSGRMEEEGGGYRVFTAKGRGTTL